MENWPKSVIIYTDGASRGNPGPAAIGIYITDMSSRELAEFGEWLGIETNNFAEYTAVIRALEIARRHGVQEILLRSDSELMVRQMTGVYKVKSPAIQPLHAEAQKLIKSFNEVKFEHVRREFNVEADRLANAALDRR